MDFSNLFDLPELSEDDVTRLRGHLAQLAADLGVSWREEDIFFLEAEGDFGEGWFVSPRIRTEFDYLVGLHEAGHHVLNVPTFEPDGETVIFDNEVAVWRWVRENALIEICERAWRACMVCLNSHEGQAPPASCSAAMVALLPEKDATAGSE